MTDTISVRVRYHNALRRQAGLVGETISLAPGARIHDALEVLSRRHGSQLRSMLLSPENEIATHLVVFCNSKLVQGNRAEFELEDGCDLMLFPATSGG